MKLSPEKIFTYINSDRTKWLGQKYFLVNGHRELFMPGKVDDIRVRWFSCLNPSYNKNGYWTMTVYLPGAQPFVVMSISPYVESVWNPPTDRFTPDHAKTKYGWLTPPDKDAEMYAKLRYWYSWYS